MDAHNSAYDPIPQGDAVPTAPHADRVWRNMTRSLSNPTDSDCPTATNRAGSAAYTTLLEGGAARTADDSTTRPWLLLRDHTTSRLPHS